jgi:predicted PurR-regulated permease PerM
MLTIFVVLEIVIPVLFGVFVVYVLIRPAVDALRRRRGNNVARGRNEGNAPT